MVGRTRTKPGAVRKRIAADLLSGRPQYDPAKGESWIVAAASAHTSRRAQRPGRIEPASPKVDVVGIPLVPESIQHAVMMVYTIGAVIGTLSEEGDRLLSIIERASPDAYAAMRRWLDMDPVGKVRWPSAYPADHPYHG